MTFLFTTMLVMPKQTLVAVAGFAASKASTTRNNANRALSVAASDWSSTSTSTRSMSSSSPDEPKREQVVLDPLIVCGPSGVGKGTIIEKFMKDNADQFGFTTSHTTRQPREGEIDKVHYNFVDKEEMKQLITMGNQFLEHAEVHGNIYGTSWDSVWKVQQEGRRCLLDIDVQGVKRVKALEHTKCNELSSSSSNSSTPSPDFRPKYLFIAPPSLDVLLERLVGRGTETPESLQQRTQNAGEELDYGMTEGNFDYILVNNNLDQACCEFEAVVRDMYGL